MKYFKIINPGDEGEIELNINNICIKGVIINANKHHDENNRGYFLAKKDLSDFDSSVLAKMNGINTFLYIIGFRSQNKVYKFCKNILGYELGKYKFPESKTYEDLLKLLEALENYYDKSHRPLKTKLNEKVI